MLGIPSRSSNPPRFAELLGWFGAEPQTAAAAKPPDVDDPAIENPALPLHFFDASLLFRCMEALQLNQNQLAENDPLLFHELQGRCALCPSKETCVEALETGFNAAAWDMWRQYCVNATTLMTLEPA